MCPGSPGANLERLCRTCHAPLDLPFQIQVLLGIEALHADFKCLQAAMVSDPDKVELKDMNNLQMYKYLLPQEMNDQVFKWCEEVAQGGRDELFEEAQPLENCPTPPGSPAGNVPNQVQFEDLGAGDAPALADKQVDGAGPPAEQPSSPVALEGTKKSAKRPRREAGLPTPAAKPKAIDVLEEETPKEPAQKAPKTATKQTALTLKKQQKGKDVGPLSLKKQVKLIF